MRQNAA